MDAMKFLKLDLRLTKDITKYYLLILALFIIFTFSKHAYVFGSAYLFFILIISASIPFNSQGNEKSTQMHYMFPAKISSMVTGRFLYLICLAFILFVVNGISVIYLYLINGLDNLQILMICLSGIISLIICFIQYPLYYKLGLEKGKIISMLIYFVPAFIVFTLPNFLLDSNLNQYIQFYKNINVGLMLLIIILLVFLIGYISYLVSYRICKKKEI